MNITANNVASKLFVAFVAAAMLFTLATPAKAATATELQAQIDALMAQISALQGSTPAATPAAGCTFTRALTVGSEGADVKCLQDYLTPKYFTNAGGSTGHFGPVTAAAVAAWQTANGVMPAAGYFGPVSQAKYAALVAATPSTPSTDDSDDEEPAAGELSGEASLKSFDIEDGDDTELEEGQTEESVQEFVVEFQDGDAMITRLDVDLNTDASEDIWDVLGDVTLYVDGDEVASMDASDEDNWMDGDAGDDNGVLRFTGLDIVAMEDEEITVTLGVEVQNNLDDNAEIVAVDVTGMRYVDGDDVTSTLEAGDTGMPTSAGSFSIAAAGSEDELIVKSSTEDPEATTLIVDDGTVKSDWYTVFAFDLDTDDSINNIDLNTVAFDVTTGPDNVNAVVQDAELVIDGVSYDDWDFTGVNGTTMGIEFDIDGDHTIDAGDRVAAELKLRFFGVGSGVDEGETISVVADVAAFDAEGVEDVVASGAASSEEHTLRSAGLVPDAASVETSTDTSGTNDTAGVFEISFEVTALEGDFYVKNTAGLDRDTTTGGIEFSVDGPASSTSATGVIASTADEDTPGVFTVREGETETFTVTVTVDASATGQHRVTLDEIIFSSNANGVTGSQAQDLLPATDYRTAYENINAV
jgi:peptidoglycan hydrolase-like protein with peptidoglycan-binding domain